MSDMSSSSAMIAPSGNSKPRPMYTPPPSIGHEIGVMFGFIGAFILSLSLYIVFWHMQHRREAKRESERMQKLRDAGYLKDGEKSAEANDGLDEKTKHGANQ